MSCVVRQAFAKSQRYYFQQLRCPQCPLLRSFPRPDEAQPSSTSAAPAQLLCGGHGIVGCKMSRADDKLERKRSFQKAGRGGEQAGSLGDVCVPGGTEALTGPEVEVGHLGHRGLPGGGAPRADEHGCSAYLVQGDGAQEVPQCPSHPEQVGTPWAP